MSKTSLVFVVALALPAFGCKKHGGDCGSAIDHSMELSKADMQKMPGMDDKTFGKLRDVTVKRCTDDKWPDSVLKCMDDAKSEKDAQGCYGQLSKEQQEKMMNAMMETVMPGAGAGGGPKRVDGSASVGSASAGSAATGSASAGSAAAPQ